MPSRSRSSRSARSSCLALDSSRIAVRISGEFTISAPYPRVPNRLAQISFPVHRQPRVARLRQGDGNLLGGADQPQNDIVGAVGYADDRGPDPAPTPQPGIDLLS